MFSVGLAYEVGSQRYWRELFKAIVAARLKRWDAPRRGGRTFEEHPVAF